jgi:hypothetical protein
MDASREMALLAYDAKNRFLSLRLESVAHCLVVSHTMR